MLFFSSSSLSYLWLYGKAAPPDRREAPLCFKNHQASEFEPRADLDGARGADITRPFAEVRTGDVVGEREISADVEAARIDEVMQVEGVEELRANLEVHFFTDPGVFDNRDVHVLVVRASQIGNSQATACVSELRERRQRLERVKVE